MNNQNLDNKTYIITGANSGIGKAAALLFAKKNATIIMACRNKERGLVAMEEIKEKTNNRNIHLMIVDMSSFDSIRNFANNFIDKYNKLDGLINNAAHFDLSQKTPLFVNNNIESVFATNYLGPFLMTKLLLPSLKNANFGRIINISSMGLLTYPTLKINFDDLSTSKNRKYSVQYAYYHSKLALLMFTRELARRVQGSTISANAIRVPNVQVDVNRYPKMPKILINLYKIKQKFSISPEEMAHIYVSLASENKYQDTNGEYINEKGKNVKFPKSSDDQHNSKILWDLSENLTHSN